MFKHTRALFVALYALWPLATHASSTLNPRNWLPGDIIHRDVAIIGAGSSGTHGAISLKDKGKSVIVIEKQDRVGGHAETYIDPSTGTPIDLGIVVFLNNSAVRDFFARFQLPLIPYHAPGLPAHPLYDFRTGEQFSVSHPSSSSTEAALAAYAAQLNKYPGLVNGTFLPSPVPEDLYMPFGQFLTKYQLQAAAPILYSSNWGTGRFLDNPTAEQMRYYSPAFVDALTNGYLTTEHRNTSEIFSMAQAELIASSDLLLNSHVIRASRSDHGVSLQVHTPHGDKLIIAKKLLISIPPKLDNVRSLDIDKTEERLFGKYINAGYYVALINNTGIPPSTVILNGAQNTAYNYPVLPAPYIFNQAVPSLPSIQIAYSGSLQSPATCPLPDDWVRADMIRAIKSLQHANPNTFTPTDPEILAFHDHCPYSLQVSSDDIKHGFYDKLYALQGQRNTYWTGAAWKAHDSGDLWAYTENQVLPAMLASF